MSQDNRSTISIIAFYLVSQSSRVLRQIRYLSRDFTVNVIGYGQLEPSFNGTYQSLCTQAPSGLMRKARTFLFLLLGRILPRWAYETWYCGQLQHQTALSLLIRDNPLFIHANDWDALPVAARASEITGARILLDLHEHAPDQWENRWYWKCLYRPMVVYFIRKYAPRTTASVTVNQTIAHRYADEYDFRPIVVMNAVAFKNRSEFRPTNRNHIRLVHHCAATRERKLEMMIQTVARTDERYSLCLMLLERSPGYIGELRRLAHRLAPGRIIFGEPAKPTEVVNCISQFDMGIHLLPFVNFNDRSSLPNKFFEFVAAGLAVCIGPSPEMARLTRQFGFGVVSESFDPDEVAQILNGLSAEDIDDMKQKSIEARRTLNADVEMGKLTDLYAELTHQT